MPVAAIVTLSKRVPPAMSTRDAAVHSFESEAEVFSRLPEFGDWLGFYDWLRTAHGEVVGVRIRPDDQEVIRLFESHTCPSVVIEDGVVTIRTSSEGVVCEALSDDADFGGNAVFLGTTGTLAIAFFCPGDRESKQLTESRGQVFNGKSGSGL